MGRARVVVTGTPVGEVDLTVVTPIGSHRTDPLPLLLANDGPDYSRRGHLFQLLAEPAVADRVRPMRVALLRAGPRHERYSANPDYAEALTEHVLPTVLTAYRTVGRPTIMGASLGALAALHTEWLRPGTFGGLFLQSGSFFRKRLGDEPDFEYWDQVTDFVASVGRSRRRRTDARIVMTCGANEGNLTNNRLLAKTLQARGHDVHLTVVPGRHDWPSWERAFRPDLVDLLALTTAGTATDGALPARIAVVDRAPRTAGAPR